MLYGSNPADFDSDFGPEESVARLLAATERPTFFGHSKEAAAGYVLFHHVWLQRTVPQLQNSFKPLYIGEFRELDGRVVLIGRFTLPGYVKTLITLWFGACICWTVATLFPFASANPATWWFPIVGVMMILFGIALVAMGKAVACDDQQWLSNVIERALKVDSNPQVQTKRHDA